MELDRVGMVTRKSFALLLAVAAVLLHVVTYAPAARAQAAVPSLAGVTRIVGSTTSATWVNIPTEARLQWKQGANPDVTIDGGGRMAGIVLSQGDPGDLNRPFVMAARSSFCASAGCTSGDSHQFVIGEMPTTNDFEWAVLKPGRYLLYLVTDGAPVSVTLKLHGLSGKSKLVPATPVDAQVNAPREETQVMGPGKKAYWFGDSGTIDAEGGLVAGIMSIKADNWMQGSYGSCLQREVRSPEIVAFSPACPAGSGPRTTEGSPLPASREIYESSIWNVTPGGDWGLGMNYVAAADVKSAAAVTLYLPYQMPPA